MMYNCITIAIVTYNPNEGTYDLTFQVPVIHQVGI